MTHGGIAEILRTGKCPGVTGTRDSFGVGKAFIHENDDGTKKVVDNWKSWEKAGYKDAVSCHKGDVKKKIIEKQKKLKRKGVSVAF